jgi:hypothetical protein
MQQILEIEPVELVVARIAVDDGAERLPGDLRVGLPH